MEQNDRNETYRHRVDKKAIIVSVSDNWRSFVEENLGADTCLPENVVGTSLWDHIRDPETRHLYEIIIQKVSENQRLASFSFRCDSSEMRRFLELKAVPKADGLVEFQSSILKTEMREPVELLRSDIERSDELIKICSMCKKIAVSETQWEEIEVAMQRLRLFELEMLPQFSHGVCLNCYNTAMAELGA